MTARHLAPAARSNIKIARSWTGATLLESDRDKDIIKRDETLDRDAVLEPGRGATKTGTIYGRGCCGNATIPGAETKIRPGWCLPAPRGRKRRSCGTVCWRGSRGILQVNGYRGPANRLADTGASMAPLCTSLLGPQAVARSSKANAEGGNQRMAEEAPTPRRRALTASRKTSAARSRRRRAVAAGEIRAAASMTRGMALRPSRAALGASPRWARPVAYILTRWRRLGLFAGVMAGSEMDKQPSSRNQDPAAGPDPKDALFAGQRTRARRTRARIASLIATCKMNAVEPSPYLKATLDRHRRRPPPMAEPRPTPPLGPSQRPSQSRS